MLKAQETRHMRIGHQLLDPVHRSLRAKVTLGIVLPLIIILGLFTAVEYERRQEAVLADLSFLTAEIGQVIENGIQHEMLSENRIGLQHMLDAIGQDKMMRVIYLLDSDGRVVFAPQGQDVGNQLDNRDPTCQPCHRLPVEQRPGSVVITLPGSQRVFRTMTPIENQPVCYDCHDPDQRLLGLLLTDFSMAPLEAPLAAELRETILWEAGMILVTVMVVNLAMSRLIIHRLENVARALARFGRGRPDLRLSAGSPDEIGQLAAAFNDMSQRIQSEEAENQALSEGLRRESAQRYELLKRLITAQEEERRRVARDLHDELGQGLGGLALSLEAIEQMWANAPEAVRDQLRHALDHADHEARRPPRAALAFQRFLQLASNSEDLVRIAVDEATALRQHQVSPRSDEELLVERLLERPQLAADRGLRKTQFLAGLRDGSLAGNHPEVQQVMVVEPLHWRRRAYCGFSDWSTRNILFVRGTGQA